MKKTIIYILLGLILIVGLYGLSTRLHPLPIEHVMYRQLLAQADAVRQLSIGDSLNLALDLRELGGQGYQAWSRGSDFFELRYQLEYLLPKLKNLKTVYIAIPYSAFYWSNGDGELAQFRQNLYTTIPRTDWIEGDFLNFLKGKLWFLVRIDHWKTVLWDWQYWRTLKNLATGEHEPRFISYGGFIRNLWYINYLVGDDLKFYRMEARGRVAADSVMSPAGLEQQARFSAGLDRRWREGVLAQRPDILQDTRAALEAISSLLKQHGIRPVYVTPPMFYRFTELFDQDVIVQMRAIMHAHAQTRGVDYFDFSEDAAFVRDYRLFSDAPHMNAAGARAFSRKLKKEIGYGGY